MAGAWVVGTATAITLLLIHASQAAAGTQYKVDLQKRIFCNFGGCQSKRANEGSDSRLKLFGADRTPFDYLRSKLERKRPASSDAILELLRQHQAASPIGSLGDLSSHVDTFQNKRLLRDAYLLSMQEKLGDQSNELSDVTAAEDEAKRKRSIRRAIISKLFKENKRA